MATISAQALGDDIDILYNKESTSTTGRGTHEIWTISDSWGSNRSLKGNYTHFTDLGEGLCICEKCSMKSFVAACNLIN